MYLLTAFKKKTVAKIEKILDSKILLRLANGRPGDQCARRASMDDSLQNLKGN